MAEFYIRLWRRPFIWLERDMLRWPGVLEISWHGLSSVGLAAVVRNSCQRGDDDGESRWPWRLHLHLLFVHIFIYMPGRAMVSPKTDDGYRQWGFNAYFRNFDALHLYWNDRSTVVWWPWGWKSVRHEVRRADGTWVPFIGPWVEGESDGRETFVWPYRYILRSGEIQRCKATVHVSRYIRRRRIFAWTSWFDRATEYVKYEFDREIGEGVGTWKGGTVASSEVIRKGETARDAFARMELTRRFGR
jgi:hypothetical protein